MNALELILTEPFFRNAALAGIIASITCGVIGPIVLVRKISAISGGIAHSVLGGMGVAILVGANPTIGALISALITALIIGTVTQKNKAQEDVLINALWALGMAVGIICISRTSGYGVDLNSYLFGNILMVSEQSVRESAALAAVVVASVGLFFKQIVAMCFDEEFAQLRGVRVKALNLIILCLVAVTVVVLLQIVGLIMVIALLALPAATAMLFVGSLARIMVLAGLIGAASSLSGLFLSYEFDLPAGATIIIVASLIYIASLIFINTYRFMTRTRG
jgi:zinc transport system permease protein